MNNPTKRDSTFEFAGEKRDSLDLIFSCDSITRDSFFNAYDNCLRLMKENDTIPLYKLLQCVRVYNTLHYGIMYGSIDTNDFSMKKQVEYAELLLGKHYKEINSELEMVPNLGGFPISKKYDIFIGANMQEVRCKDYYQISGVQRKVGR
jgi:hypothetical protein